MKIITYISFMLGMRNNYYGRCGWGVLVYVIDGDDIGIQSPGCTRDCLGLRTTQSDREP